MSGIYKGLTYTELNSMILWELGQVSGTTVSNSKFPATRMRVLLTERQNQFVYHTHCLKRFALIPAVAGQRVYKLPINCMEGGLISAKFYESSSSYEELRVVDKDYMDNAEEGYQVSSSGVPDYAWMGDTYGQIQTMEVDPPPDTGGTDYLHADNIDTGVYYGTDLPERSDDLTGTATGGDATSLLDTGTTFTEEGLVTGMYVRNTTDGSYGYITKVEANDLTISTLTGGTANVFAADDEYIVLAGEYGAIVEQDRTDQYIFPYRAGHLNSITVPANNFYIEYVPYPLEFATASNDNQYPEIPKVFHKALAMGVVADYLGSFHEKTKEFQRAQFYEQQFMSAVELGKMKKESRPWKNKPVRLRPGRR